MAFGDTIKDLHGIPIPQVYVNGVGFVALKGAAADPADGSSNTSTTAAMTIEGPPGIAPYQASVMPAGELRVAIEAGQLFQEGFDTSTLDITNRWKAPTAAGGGVAATNALTNTQLGTGTTISGYSYLESAVSFPPTNPSWLLFYTGVNLAFPIVANQYFFWGLGTSPGSPTAAAPLTNACGFEVTTAGKMFAVTYQSGTRVVVQDLSSSGNNKQPLDANVHKYYLYYKGDNIYWCIDGLDAVVAFTSTGAPGPDVNILPIKFTAIAGAVAPVSSGVLTVNTVNLADTGSNNIQISDGTYPWRQQMVTAGGASVATNVDGYKATYTVNYFGLVPVTGATDIFTITGSATKTIKIARVEFSMTITTATQLDVMFIKRSTADTAGTVVTTNQTITPHDSANAATTATFQAFTANPTLGSLVGSMGIVKYFAQGPAIASAVYIKEYGVRPSQMPTLRGIAQVFAINLNGTALAGGQLVDLSIEYTEE
jgi:hypothetical protein